ncbi:hypothetical protein BDN70DRAFT_996555 [Pholiota conissans]|uniref:Uncharacterized protein n=1 Tax=Pholiota conissans TaxID=109636 RepID=A0A9P6CPY9_9AGAR|nr:hypothetical protein BDN70DRAFT_996555 [Pholiota conissans]
MASGKTSPAYDDNSNIEQILVDIISTPKFTEGLDHLLASFDLNSSRGIAAKGLNTNIHGSYAYEKGGPTNDFGAIDFSDVYASNAQYSGCYDYSTSSLNGFQNDQMSDTSSSSIGSPFTEHWMNREYESISQYTQMFDQLAPQDLHVVPFDKAYETGGSLPIKNASVRVFSTLAHPTAPTTERESSHYNYNLRFDLASAEGFTPNSASRMAVRNSPQRTAKGQMARKVVKDGGVQKKKVKAVEEVPVVKDHDRKPQVYDPNLFCFYAMSAKDFNVKDFRKHKGLERKSRLFQPIAMNSFFSIPNLQSSHIDFGSSSARYNNDDKTQRLANIIAGPEFSEGLANLLDVLQTPRAVEKLVSNGIEGSIDEPVLYSSDGHSSGLWYRINFHVMKQPTIMASQASPTRYRSIHSLRAVPTKQHYHYLTASQKFNLSSLSALADLTLSDYAINGEYESVPEYKEMHRQLALHGWTYEAAGSNPQPIARILHGFHNTEEGIKHRQQDGFDLSGTTGFSSSSVGT